MVAITTNLPNTSRRHKAIAVIDTIETTVPSSPRASPPFIFVASVSKEDQTKVKSNYTFMVRQQTQSCSCRCRWPRLSPETQISKPPSTVMMCEMQNRYRANDADLAAVPPPLSGLPFPYTLFPPPMPFSVRVFPGLPYPLSSFLVGEDGGSIPVC
jgi:hypothetical protein